MIDYNQFRTSLKAAIRRTEPDRAGIWKRYLIQEAQGFDEFVASLCYSFLVGDAQKRAQAAQLIDDDDVLWYFQEFITTKTESIKGQADIGPLIQGLLAVVLIAVNSDPRDISTWIYRLNRAAVSARVSGASHWFHKISALLPPELRFVSDWLMTYSAPSTQSTTDCAACSPSEVSADVDSISFTPLMLAAIQGDIRQLKLLIASGANLNAQFDGVSALALAAFAGRRSAVETLLDAGATVGTSPHGMSLLEFAGLDHLDPAIVQRLRDAGAR